MGEWITRWKTFVSKPLPQRLSAQDTTNYLQPQPHYDPQYYLTYWRGNQLPGQFIHVQNPFEVWVSVRDKRVLYTSSPYAAQRDKNSFNRNLSQDGSAQIVAQWRAAWQAAAAAQAK